MTDNSKSKKDSIGVIMLIIALLTLVVGLMVVPEFRAFVGLDRDKTSTPLISLTPTTSTFSAPISTPTEATYFATDISSSFTFINLCEGDIVNFDAQHVTIGENGNCHISLSSGEVIIGDAEKFQDEVNESAPPCSAFAVIGPVEIDLQLVQGGMDYYHYLVDESKIQEKIDTKVQNCQKNHPDRQVQTIKIPETVVVPTDCWRTVWSFNPSDLIGYSLELTQPLPGFTATIDREITNDGFGSLRIETNKTSSVDDPNAWSWLENQGAIIAEDGMYRLVAWVKTQNVVQSHIAIIGRDANGKDVSANGSDQISITPTISLDGTKDGMIYSSREFNPIKWNPAVKNLIIGINAGWSPDGKPAITWFDNIELQYCSK